MKVEFVRLFIVWSVATLIQQNDLFVGRLLNDGFNLALYAGGNKFLKNAT